MLDSPEDVCADEAQFEYPATFVRFKQRIPVSGGPCQGGALSRL
jgi:hypothetical protein